MSSEVGGVIFLPALIGIGLLIGAGALVDGAANAVADRQRERLAAADRLSQVRAEYEAFRRRIAAARSQYGDRISGLPPLAHAVYSGKNPARAATAVAEIAARLQVGESQLRGELAAARTAAAVAGVLALLSDTTAGQGRPPGTPRQPRAKGKQPDPTVVESVSRILGRLETAVPAPTVDMLVRRAEQLLSVPPSARAQLLLDDLRVQVQQANAEVAAKQKRAAALAARLSGYDGPEIDQARLRLCLAVDDPEPNWPGLAQMTTQAVERTFASALREYAARALRESLAEIGCEAEEEFETLLVRDGIAHVRRPGWDDLAVRVRLRPEDQAFHFNVIRPNDVEAKIDEGAETDWCSAFDSLLAILAGKGVEFRVDERSSIGDGTVQHVDPARYPFPRKQQDRWAEAEDEVWRETQQ